MKDAIRLLQQALDLYSKTATDEYFNAVIMDLYGAAEYAHKKRRGCGDWKRVMEIANSCIASRESKN